MTELEALVARLCKRAPVITNPNDRKLLYDCIDALTPLAPAQAEIERLQSLLDERTEALNTAEGEVHRLTLRNRDLAADRLRELDTRLAAEEQVRVLSEAARDVSIAAWRDRHSGLYADPSIIALDAALAALQHKDNQHGR